MSLTTLARTSPVKVVAVALCVALGLATRLPSAGAAERAQLAGRFSFQASALGADPAGARTIRPVAPGLRNIQSWISAVGASVALADFDGDGLPNERCLVDPRDDSVTIAPTPEHADRFASFALRPTGVRFDARTTAPMGCVSADLNEDGYTDALVYFWGRTPIAFRRRPDPPLGRDAFVAPATAPPPDETGNSPPANVLDLDGDGHLDVFVGNYFPDGARVLDPTAVDNPLMQMQDSMSNAHNAGRNRILRLQALYPAGGVTRPAYEDQSGALTDGQARSWTLATGAQDLDGDGLPELYLANDFGPDNLLANRSRPGHIAFAELFGQRDHNEPKSKVLGHDSFKGMGVTYTDINRDGRPDIVVSNITTSYALEESNFAFVSTGSGPLTDGVAPYRDDSQALGLARTGWAWDVKAADFDGDGEDELVQALGFIAGDTNRWAELQELAMGNDELLRHPGAWPVFRPGVDIAGHQRNPFFVRDRSGRYVDIAADLGLANPGVSRGIAIADVDHDGRPDAAIANQWAASTFLHNTGPRRGYLGLQLLLPTAHGPARPAIGAPVPVVKPDATTLRQQLYPANGHTRVNSPELLLGLGTGTGGPLSVTVRWRDIAGPHGITTTLSPRWQ